MSALELVDTHCHLDLPVFDGDRDAVVARARAAGVTRILVPSIRPSTWDATTATAAAYPDVVRIALGAHPQIAPELDAAERAALARLPEALEACGAIAVGECGLDGNTPDPAAQEAVFRAQIRAARDAKLPLVVHVYKAVDATLRVLRDEHAGDVGGVIHSYSGPPDLVPRFSALGFAFSLAGPVTYERARRPLEAARAIPPDLLLVETDAPDQTPVPHRGTRNEPAWVTHVAAALAAHLGEDPAALAARTSANAARVFRL